MALEARELVEASRNLARLSRDEMLPALRAVLIHVPEPLRSRQSKLEQESRMSLVMDCYLTGCAEMLKRLMGDPTPEPWEKYDHETRLAELLAMWKQRTLPEDGADAAQERHTGGKE